MVLDDGLFTPKVGHHTDDQWNTYSDLRIYAQVLDKPVFGVLGFTDAHKPWQTPPGFPLVLSDSDKYLQEIEYLDQKIGSLMFSVAAWDWLIVVGDNGTPDEVSPEPGRSKLTVYERGIHVPLIIRGPGFVPGSSSSSPVSSMDLFQTVAALLAIPAVSEGQDLRDPKRGWVYASNPTYNFGEGRHAIVEEQYKLIRNEGPVEEFYDLLNDPGEQNKLPLSGPDYDRLKGLLDGVTQ